MSTRSAAATARTFAALADPSRCRVVERLADRPASAGELAGLVGLTASSMSRHLKVLLDAGLVSDERGRTDARIRLFRLRPEGIDDSAAWIEAIQQHWQRNLASFARHVVTRGDAEGGES